MTEARSVIGRKLIGYKIKTREPETIVLNEHHAYCLDYLWDHQPASAWAVVHSKIGSHQLGARLTELKMLGFVETVTVTKEGHIVQLIFEGTEIASEWRAEKRARA